MSTQLEAEYRRWRAQAEREITAVSSGNPAAARALVAGGRGRDYFDAIRRTHGRLQDRIDAETTRAEQDVTAASRTLFVAIGIGAVGALVFTLLARRLLARWASDVDAQQQALVALGEQTRLVDGLTRQTPDPIFLKDATGRYRFVNEGAARVMCGGRRPESAHARTPPPCRHAGPTDQAARAGRRRSPRSAGPRGR